MPVAGHRLDAAWRGETAGECGRGNRRDGDHGHAGREPGACDRSWAVLLGRGACRADGQADQVRHAQGQGQAEQDVELVHVTQGGADAVEELPLRAGEDVRQVADVSETDERGAEHQTGDEEPAVRHPASGQPKDTEGGDDQGGGDQ